MLEFYELYNILNDIINGMLMTKINDINDIE